MIWNISAPDFKTPDFQNVAYKVDKIYNVFVVQFFRLLWKSKRGAETNCSIAHILGILLMISYCFAFYFSNIIVVCTVSIKRIQYFAFWNLHG